ncbi:hypothetical protein IAD21_00746 [Abditibacteriota bacterium]|nr:hypothetical protein IAD21_00746 [Abditibacteriota bacterium]
MPQTQTTMTEQEAEIIAARLKRIWGLSEPMDILESLSGYWVFNGCLKEPAFVSIQIKPWGIKPWDNRFTLYYLYYKDEVGNKESVLVCRGTDEIRINPHGGWGQFAPQWLPLFRRGCWLCGCPIEATLHEKMEWIQGFTREEIEAWNLKM